MKDTLTLIGGLAALAVGTDGLIVNILSDEVMIALSTVAIIGLFGPSMVAALKKWRAKQPEYGQGFIVFAVVVALTAIVAALIPGNGYIEMTSFKIAAAGAVAFICFAIGVILSDASARSDHIID